MRLWSAAPLAPFLLAAAALASLPLLQEPTHPVCATPTGLQFCSMVDYEAVLNASEADGTAADDRAQQMHLAVERVLARFDCSERYGYWNCTSCRDAYKYWACAVSFPRCGPNGNHSTCPAAQQCAWGRRRPCRSICEDVVRKCPYVLEFTCPEEDTVDYVADIDLCNKLDREFYPPGTSGPWPGTFSTDSGVAPVHPSSLVHAVVTLAASHLLIGHC